MTVTELKNAHDALQANFVQGRLMTINTRYVPMGNKLNAKVQKDELCIVQCIMPKTEIKSGTWLFMDEEVHVITDPRQNNIDYLCVHLILYNYTLGFNGGLWVPAIATKTVAAINKNFFQFGDTFMKEGEPWTVVSIEYKSVSNNLITRQFMGDYTQRVQCQNSKRGHQWFLLEDLKKLDFI